MTGNEINENIEWNQQRREIERLTAALAESTRAREQAENAHEETLRDLDVRGQQLDGAAAAAADLKRERDTALARVKELEADRHEYVVKLDALREQIHEQAIAGREDGKLIAELKADSKRSDSLRVAEVAAARRAQQSAETALASARELLERAAATLDNADLCNTAKIICDWLTSHPAPAAAPCAVPCATEELVEPTRTLADYDTLQGLSDAMLYHLEQHAYPARAHWASHELVLRGR